MQVLDGRRCRSSLRPPAPPGLSSLKILAVPFSRGHLDRRDPGQADTFFVASRSRTEIPVSGGVNISHCAGRPGFVFVDGDTLIIPDFPVEGGSNKAHRGRGTAVAFRSGSGLAPTGCLVATMVVHRVVACHAPHGSLGLIADIGEVAARPDNRDAAAPSFLSCR
jgi:hypothetical protein